MINNSYLVKCKAAGFDKELSLDELWKLFKDLYPKKTDYELISKIRINMSQSGCDSFLQKQSVHEAFLMSYMYGKNNSCWDNRNTKWT